MAYLNDDKISKLIRECIRSMIIASVNEKIEKVPFQFSIDETTQKYSQKEYFSIMINIYVTCNLIYIHLRKAQKN